MVARRRITRTEYPIAFPASQLSPAVRISNPHPPPRNAHSTMGPTPIATGTRVPSRPRLMRAERSVMHSPRLTNRNGVETRMAPPNTASGTVQRPIVPSAMSGFAFQKANSSIQRVAGENEDEDDPLQHL